MSQFLKKTYPEPKLAQAETKAEYYERFAQALRRLQDTTLPAGEDLEGSPFFYLLDFPFLDGSGTFVWIGVMNAAWKSYYKALRRRGDFAAGTVVKSADLGKESIPYTFLIEEGKGAKKATMQAVRREVKKQVGKNIEFLTETDLDTTVGAGADAPVQAESPSDALFAGIQQCLGQYRRADAAKAPLLKMELRRQLSALLNEWNNLPSEATTPEQQAFINAFKTDFLTGGTLYKDRALELWALQKKDEQEYKNLAAQRTALFKNAGLLSGRIDPEFKKQLRQEARDLYRDWQALQEEIQELIQKHQNYFEGSYVYTSVPEDGLQIQAYVGQNAPKMLALVQPELERAKDFFVKAGGMDGELDPPGRRLELPQLPEPANPNINRLIGDYQNALQGFEASGRKEGGEALQMQVLAINDLAEQQSKDLKNQIETLENKIQELRKELAELKTKDDEQSKARREELSAELNKLLGQGNLLRDQASALTALQTQLFAARKDLALVTKTDAEYLAALRAHRFFLRQRTVYIAFVKQAKHPNKETAARQAAAALLAMQKSIDALDRRIEAWKELHRNDLWDPAVKNKDRELSRMQASILEFVKQYKGFVYANAEEEPPAYNPDNDALFVKQLQPALRRQAKERQALIEQMLQAAQSAPQGKFQGYAALCLPRLKTVKSMLRAAGLWHQQGRLFGADKTLEARRKEVQKLQNALYEEQILWESFNQIDALVADADKIRERLKALDKERENLENKKKQLQSIDDTKLKPEQYEALQHQLTQVRNKIYYCKQTQNQQALAADQAASGFAPALARLQKALGAEHSLVQHLRQYAQSNLQANADAGDNYLKAFAAELLFEYQEAMKLDGEDRTRALLDLQRRIAPFYAGLAGSPARQAGNVFLQAQILLSSITQALERQQGGTDSAAGMAKLIDARFQIVKNEQPTASVIAEMELLVQTIDQWKDTYFDRERPEIQKIHTHLQALRGNLTVQLERDDLEAARKQLQAERLVQTCRSQLQSVRTRIDSLEQPDDAAKAIAKKLPELQTRLNRLDLQANTLQSLPEAQSLLAELQTRLYEPLRQAERVLLQLESPQEQSREVRTFAGLGAGWERHVRGGLPVPVVEQLHINAAQSKAALRIEAMMDSGMPPSEILGAVRHIPSSMLPKRLFEQLYARRRKERAQSKDQAPDFETLWKQIDAAAAPDLEAAVRVFVQAAQGQAQALSELMGDAPKYARLLVAANRACGEGLAQAYCQAHAVLPEDLDDATCAERLLTECLLDAPSDTAPRMELALAGKEDAETEEEIAALDRKTAEQIDAQSPERKTALLALFKNAQPLTQGIGKEIENARPLLALPLEALPDMQQRLLRLTALRGQLNTLSVPFAGDALAAALLRKMLPSSEVKEWNRASEKLVEQLDHALKRERQALENAQRKKDLQQAKQIAQKIKHWESLKMALQQAVFEL